MQVKMKNQTVHISELTLGRVVRVTFGWTRSTKYCHLVGFDENAQGELILVVQTSQDGKYTTHPSNVELVNKPVEAQCGGPG